MSSTPEQVITDERLDTLERWKDEIETKFKAAFPNGDYVGHCGYHELMIEDLRDRKKLIAALREKTMGGLIWGGIVLLALAVWQYIKAQIKGA